LNVTEELESPHSIQGIKEPIRSMLKKKKILKRP